MFHLRHFCACLISLFSSSPPSAGYPIASYVTKHGLSLQGGFNIGGTNASGQVSPFAVFPVAKFSPDSVYIYTIKYTTCTSSLADPEHEW